MSVPIKITNFSVRPSADPMRPITIAFHYEGRGKDHPVEGVELDVTRDEARQMAHALYGVAR